MGSKNVAIAGGGFFGLYLAEQLALKGCKVTVYEKSQELMSRASYVNQARVHNGYHYPRSILTAYALVSLSLVLLQNFATALKMILPNITLLQVR